MMRWNRRGVPLLCVLLLMAAVPGVALGKPPKNEPGPVLLIVLDPLSKELACACVNGFGQRDYRKLAARLETNLKQRVGIEFSDDLAESLTSTKPGQEVIVVGEQSLVVRDAKKTGIKCHPVCALTDADGDSSLTGLFVARADDPANELKSLGERKVFSGLADTDENRAAVRAVLPIPPEKRASFSDAALDVLDSSASPPPVAVIPAYALRLLEGCGSVKHGELKVIGKTSPVPFITVFVADAIAADKQEKILQTLLGVKNDTKLLKAMESQDGFKVLNTQTSAGTRASTDWPDWRGPGRDGHVPRLPSRLPTTARCLWKKAAVTGGLAGLSVSGGRLILAERDFAEEHDVYRCLDTANGELLWRVEFPAAGKLDYGQFPRATPVIHEGRAFLLGAFGDLRCVNITNGKQIWKRQLPREFKAELPTWGMCSTPLVVDDVLIVNPGGAKASVAALDCATGRTRWTTPGSPAAYASFICGEFGGRRQIVGYDQHSLGGWDVKTGARLWQLVPPMDGDFNVPTPIAVSGGVLVATENNGARLYRFDDAGRIMAKPAGEFTGLAPDTVTPVATCGRVFGALPGLHCLDAQNHLQPVWHRDDDDLGDYATLIADDERVLVATVRGELLLLDARVNECTIISRLRLFEDDAEMYSHPALVGTRIYARAGANVFCVDLAGE